MNQPITPQEESTPPQQQDGPSQTQGGSKGALIGAIIVVILLIVAAVFVFVDRSEQDNIADTTLESASEIEALPDETLDALTTQSSSDEISAIEEDLTNTNLDDIDTELDAIDQELQAEGF